MSVSCPLDPCCNTSPLTSFLSPRRLVRCVAGIREVVYASGVASGCCCWLVVNHQPACRLKQWQTDDELTLSYLSCRVVVQNIREEPLDVVCADLALGLRNGAILAPLQAPAGLPADPLPLDEPAHSHGRTVVQPASSGSIVRLKPLQVAVLTDVRFPVPAHMRFEPDVLEASEQLHVHALSVADPPEHVAVRCGFASEDEIWKHYELINRDVRCATPSERPRERPA
jgi:hypothetical protein